MHRSVRNLIRKSFELAGWELRRIKRDSPLTERSPILEDPREAFMTPNHGGGSFKGYLRLAVDHQAFGFGESSWHPFVDALHRSQGERESLCDALRSFYEMFQPANAQEAIVGFRASPKAFETLPPYMFFLAPWANTTRKSVERTVSKWVAKDNEEHGKALGLAEGGFQSFGPVSEEKLLLEAGRLSEIFYSLRDVGYDRRFGDCKFRIVKLGSEIRLIADGGGYHRTAAAAALNMTCVPGEIFPLGCIADVDDVHLWPNVRSGLWSQRQAIDYVEHLFFYDTRGWAKSLGLCGSCGS